MKRSGMRRVALIIVLAMLCGDADLPVREIVREINRPEYRIEL